MFDLPIPEYVCVTKGTWKKCVAEITTRIFILLDSAEKLLNGYGDKKISAGLYTYAVEEYGKLLLLKNYPVIDGKVKIPYKNEFRKHSRKFAEAIKVLPNECIALHKGIFTEEIFSGDNQVFDVEQLSDFESRTAIFYTDFNAKCDDIAFIPSVTVERLKKAIITLKKITAEAVAPT